ncbi:MAG: efflux RND transporter periplasmic adaptor subunit [Scytolyngbya sp. HA4215-MV1]|nr:efflux RND transporter periplasmic adaptor subunit [Scytolyngbya sp. HA4215-MV1]
MSGEDITRTPVAQPVLQEEKADSSQEVQETENTEPISGKRRFLVPGIIGLVVLGGLGWIVFNRVILPILIFSQMGAPPPTPVQISNPQTATVEDSSDYAASLDSRQSVTLQPRVAGQISAIYVKSGQQVSAGDPILQIDAAEQRAQVASRAAAVDTAEADISAAQADVANAIDNLNSLQAKRASAQSTVELNQREYARYQDLYSQGATSKQVLDQKLNALQTSQADLRQADADIRAQQSAINRNRATVVKNQRAMQEAEANVSQVSAQLGYYSINAPFSGIVGDIPVKEGDFVDVGNQLLILTQNRELEIQIAIPLERSSLLRRGLPVKLLDDRDQVLQTGRISFIAPNVDAATQSVLIKAKFANAGNKLRTAQFVRARVVWSASAGVVVPTSVISRLGGKDFIFVATSFKESKCEAPAQTGFGGASKVQPNQLTAAQKPIKLGKIVGNNQEVLEGLKASDRIITSNILQLQNCMPISDAAAQPAKSP